VALHVIAVFSFVVTAAGLALMLRSGLGMGPWGAFEQALSKLAGMSFGTSVQLVGVALVAVAWTLGERPTLVTLLNMLLVGEFTDVFLRLVRTPEAPAVRAAVFAVGLVVYSIGVALCVSLRIGVGPREALMLGVMRRAHTSLRAARIAIDMSVLVIAWAVKGPIGIGTVAYAVGAGPLIQLFVKGFRRTERARYGA